MFLGDEGVGKTAAINSYVENKKPGDQQPTLFDTYEMSTTVNGKQRKLTIHDAGGNAANLEFRRMTFPGTDCFVVCFSLDKKSSLLSTYTKWLDELKVDQQVTHGVPRILVGMKSDLKRDVSKEEAEEIAKSNGFLYYEECSAEAGDNIPEVFCQAALAGLRKKIELEI